MQVADTPAHYGFNAERYPMWRPGQRETIQRIVDWYLSDGPPVLMLEAPTGVGKSIIAGAVLRHLFLEDELEHGIITTTTLNLQRQYMSDTLADVAVSAWGRSNHECLILPVSVADAPCTAGYHCTVRFNCSYYNERDTAQRAPLSVLNTAFWLTSANYAPASEALRREQDDEFENLFTKLGLAIHDEAHLLERAIQSLVEVQFSRQFFQQIGAHIPESANPGEWHTFLDAWEPAVRMIANAYRDNAKRAAKTGQVHDDAHGKRAVAVHRSMTRAVNEILPAHPLIEPTDFGYKFRAVWGKEFAPTYLWNKAKKHLLMSATIIHPEFIAESLGLDDGDWAYIEMPSPFAPMRRRVVYDPVLKVNYHTTEAEFGRLIFHMDDLISAKHMEQKGIVHAVSYTRAQQIVHQSRHRGRMVTHGNKRGDKEHAIETFLAAEPGAILVSPSVGVGEDFGRGDNCRFQIFPKYPIPSMGDPVARARAETNKESMWFEADMAFVQAVGRGMRSEDDSCVSYLLDSSGARQLYKLPQSIKDAIIDQRPAKV